MRTTKDALHTLLWAIAVIIVIPVFFGIFSPEKSEIEAFSESSEIFSEELSDLSKEESIPENAIPVVSARLEGNAFKNYTKYEINKSDLVFSSSDYSASLKAGLPLVLIIHTYGTQAYNDNGYITPDETLKSENEAKNVILAGEKFKSTLEENGIVAIHHKEFFDKISYSGAYTLSTEKILEYIEKYPSIKFIFDIQRDSLFTNDGKCVKAITDTTKGKTAQILFISGSDENGADFPLWKENLSLSFLLSEKLANIKSDLTRGVCLMPSGYGQYASAGYVTVKIGTAGNTTQEVKNASAYLAEALCEIIEN